MNDIDNVLTELADAAARAAEHGIVGRPALPETLQRVAGRVRRRRAARAVGASALALALLGGGATAVLAWSGGGGTPPAGPTTSASTTPTPTVEPTPSGSTSPGDALSDFACGKNGMVFDEDFVDLDGPFVLALTAPPVPSSATDEPLGLVVTVDNLGARDLAPTSTAVAVLIDADHFVVGAVALTPGFDAPLPVGGSGTYTVTSAPEPCPGATTVDGRLPAGEYGVAAVVQAVPLDSSDVVVSVGGPFAVTLTD